MDACAYGKVIVNSSERMGRGPLSGRHSSAMHSVTPLGRRGTVQGNDYAMQNCNLL